MTDRKTVHTRYVIRELIRRAARYRAALNFAIAASALVALTGFATLAMLKPIVEVVFDQPRGAGNGMLDFLLAPVYQTIEYFVRWNRLGTLAVVCVLFFLISALRCLFRFTQVYVTQWIGNRVILDLQRDLYDKITGYNAAYYARRPIGGLLSYFTADIRLIGVNIFNSFSQLLLDPFQIVVLVIGLLLIHWPLTLIYALVIPLLIFTVRYFARKNRRASREAQDVVARIGAFLQDHFRLIRVVQAYGMQDAQRSVFHRETEDNFLALLRKARAVAMSSPINELIGVAAVCVILLLGGWVIFVQQSMPASDFVVFLGGLVSLYQPLRRIERTIQEMQHGFAAAERVFEAMEENAELPEPAAPVKLAGLRDAIEFDGVSFSYDGERPVLAGVSFTARRGEQVALVGPSGAGKTTLVNLIPRFYDPTSGAIRFDGVDLREMSLTGLRSLIAFVPQDQAVFAGSIWNNITCGQSDVDEDRVAEAARAAYAHEFIMDLPHGYQTVIGDEEGGALSGGQCQRVAIARAFFRDAPVLILDEATSALDSESERRIKASLEKLLRGRTAFIIAHRLSTILQADRILVMDEGRVVDSGRHLELLQRCALYQRLYRLQFEDQASAAAPS
ncbi:MAG: ATP-binding cassette domain-containing protein [bacterium]|nr:ATP-binding cassette domain-containing protein [bacterium]